MKEMKCKIVIIGGGPAGYSAALNAAYYQKNIIIIDENEIGGVCLNEGCIPTKSMIRNSEIFHMINHSKKYGINVSESTAQWEEMKSLTHHTIYQLRQKIIDYVENNEIKIIKGRGTVVDSKTVLVKCNHELITICCEKLILAIGSESLDSFNQLGDTSRFITSKNIFSEMKIPQKIGIVGAGIVGIEYAFLFQTLGCRVTIFEKTCKLFRNDIEISNEIQKRLIGVGINIQLGAEVNKITAESEVYYNKNNQENIEKFDEIVLAIGRKPNLETVCKIPLKINNGYIAVNKFMETNISGVYAAGDVIGGNLLAHVACAEGRVAGLNACDIKEEINYVSVPQCIYMNPEISWVGVSEAEAKKKGLSVFVGKAFFRNNGRAATLGENEGYVKVIADKNLTIVGGQIIGYMASELISQLCMAIDLKLNARYMANVMFPHPSLSEAISEACACICKKHMNISKI